MLESQALRGSAREIDQPAPGYRTTVIDFHNDRTAVSQVRHLDSGSERQSPMRCRQPAVIVRHAACRRAASERRTIPTRYTQLNVPGCRRMGPRGRREQGR
jgi:hypothetical protein